MNNTVIYLSDVSNQNVPYFEDFDYTEIFTRIKVDVLEGFFKKSNFCQEERKFIVDGIRYGFPLGYQGSTNRKDLSNNLKLRCGDKYELWRKMMKEVNLHRFAGPFETIPFKNFVQSPVGLMSKANNLTHLIFHLSYDFKEFKSINYYTPKELCSVKYNDLDQAILLCSSLGQGCRMVKSDLKSAFRHLPIKPQDYRWLIMKAKHPRTGKMRFFIEECVAFGSLISCSHYQRVSNALHHIFVFRTKSKVTNYLDDFFFVALVEHQTNQLVQDFLQICTEINFPVSTDKTEWASTLVGVPWNASE